MYFIMQKWAVAYKGTSTYLRYIDGLSEPDRYVFEKYFVELLPEHKITDEDYYNDDYYTEDIRRKSHLKRISYIYRNWLEFIADEIAAGYYIALEGDEYLNHILNQVVINSKIASVKMKNFNKALKFSLFFFSATILLIITTSFISMY